MDRSERIQFGKREQNIGVSLADICPACITNVKDSFRTSSVMTVNLIYISSL